MPPPQNSWGGLQGPNYVPPASAAGSTPGPSAGQIAAVFAAETSTEIYIIQVTGAIEVAFAHVRCIVGLIYCSAAPVASELKPTAGTTFIGATVQHLTEVRVSGDENSPILINETGKSESLPCRRYVKGTAGDRLILKYR